MNKEFDNFNYFDYSKKIKRKNYHFKFPKINLNKISRYVIIILIVLNFISPIFLFFASAPTEMSFVIGNPKPIYLYDIDSSCSKYESNIISSLNHLSEKTGVKFKRLENPIAVLSGGISFSCENIMSDYGVVGEAESGYFMLNWFVVAWNNIRLSSISQEVIQHETLHIMGFGHSSDPTSIMYLYANGQDIENSLSQFIKKYYTSPLTYLNIIPLNLLLVLLLFIFIIFREE